MARTNKVIQSNFSLNYPDNSMPCCSLIKIPDNANLLFGDFFSKPLLFKLHDVIVFKLF